MELESLYSLDEHEAGSEFQVVDQRGKPTKLWITVQGPDSRLYRAEQRKSRREVLEHLQRAQDGSVKLEEYDEEKRDTETLVRLTLSWCEKEKEDDEPKEIAFSADRVRELYVKAPYIRDQVDRFIGKRANFTKG